jgi:signal transduction histidine kinase/phage shock protein PspC (stress-responsive transcriptional regulator)
MSTTASEQRTAEPAAATVRRATRSADDRYVGGVAGGLAAHLGVDPMLLRAVFVGTSLVQGLGLLVYAGLWLTMPLERGPVASAPGLEAAARQGKRPPASRRLRDAGPAVAMAALMIGILVLGHQLLGGFPFFWPLLLAVLGVVVLWRQADEAQRERMSDSSRRVGLWRAVVGEGGASAYGRLAAGVALLAAALTVFALQTGGLSSARAVLTAGALAAVGLGLILGPFLFRLAGDLSEERAARVRQQERADMAAHLHDSVLQTLALIQKSAGDGPTVSRLARAQERDLRQWLYGEPAAADVSVAAALRGAAAEVEDAHGVPVEVVTVGDLPSGERSTPLVLAAREAMVNAAKHSGAGKVDVYAELGPDVAEVFVRDRGAGFDLDGVGEDRFGVRHSIVDRMHRHGGRADVRTAPGEGTEVRLSMSTSPSASPSPGPSASPSTGPTASPSPSTSPSPGPSTEAQPQPATEQEDR